jgi:hypothetical protein
MKESIKTDVAVVGGGTAGSIAAISAADAGASTVLIEKNGILGGTMTSSFVSFPGLFFAWGKQIISGYGWRANKRAEQLGGAKIPKITYKPEGHWEEQISLNRFVYARVLDEFCLDAGVEIRLHTILADAAEADGGIRLITAGKEGLKRIHAKIVIDATADANLTSLLGYPCAQSETLQPATLVNRISGYDLAEVDKDFIAAATKEALCCGRLPAELHEESIYSYLTQHSINFHNACPDAASSEGKTALELSARKKLMGLYEFMRGLPKLENLRVDIAAVECGVRETKRIIGEKVITAGEYLAGILYGDAVCYAFYPIDLHVMEGIEQEFLADGVVPSIPYKALIPKGAARLLAAGRCVSSDAAANSALRVQAPCMAMGQAAGCAAALAARHGLPVGDVPYGELCALLKKQGAIVPKNAL